ncbi:alpha/beta fold hydrolase [Exilibacterium tricleocarpae]|uniref:Alpha/beta fold hydrolase n=1 Tax=Exilibacterium tricleocarpae TaxID=2591008 RepID=A0A545U9I0_9GAMM|nr:alpha/beta fold hydrolase [Exilibacterium tricleocarpae]TQV86127.1 alpha/beta fold hydrolase [Exilibacterium tricleocarpae]
MKSGFTVACVVVALSAISLAYADAQIRWLDQCPVGASPETRCGELLVPERRDLAQSRTIVVPIAVIPAPDQTSKAPDPFLFLMGGTGGGFSVLRDVAALPSIMNRDVIVMEQRGNPMATPFFGCPDVPFADRLHLVYNSNVTYTGEESVNACRRNLLDQNIDLQAYTTPSAAEDLIALRQALDIESWNVYGVSYGGRVATTLMRKDPKAIRSVVLDSAQITGTWFSPWERLSAIGTFFDRCAAAPHCGALYPKLRKIFEKTINRLHKRPESILYAGKKDRIDAESYLHLVVWSLYQMGLDATSRLPAAILASGEGDFNALLAINSIYAGYKPAYVPPNTGYNPLEVHNAQQISMLCAEEFPYNRNDKGRQKAVREGWNETTVKVLQAIEKVERQICDQWGFEPDDPAQAQAPVGDRPTLILYGEHDTIAPPSHGRIAHESLDNARFYIFPWTAHAVIYERQSCSIGVIRAFIENPSGNLDTSCISAIAEPVWVPPHSGRGGHPLALMHAHAANSVVKYGLPGRSVYVSAPRINVDGVVAVGIRDARTNTPLTGTETFRVASQTKMFTAAAILRLMEEDKLSLRQPIAGLISQAAKAELIAGGYDPEAITVHQLIEHTSGMPDYATDPAYQQAISADPSRQWTRLQQIRWGAVRMRSIGKPGEVFHYSDTGYVLLSEIIERATGMPQAAAYRTLIDYKRLGLRHTWFESLEAAAAGAPPRARQYAGPIDITDINPSFDLYGGGGLISTLQDQVRFIQQLFAGKVFKQRSTLDRMLHISPTNLSAKTGDGYALGINRVTVDGVVCWGHSGFFGSAVYHCPDEQISVAANRYTASAPPTYNGRGPLQTAILMQRLRTEPADRR